MKIRHITFYFCFAFACCVFFSLHLSSADSCITTDCHNNFKKRFTVLHPPVQKGCTSCHKKTGSHNFTLKKGQKLCYSCHNQEKDGKHVKEDIPSYECLDCHNPHGGNKKGLLKVKKTDSLCYECHDKISATKTSVHKPILSGDCTGCHDFHSTDSPSLLSSEKHIFCQQCHKGPEFASLKKHTHTILKKGCDNCHSPHFSDFQHLLKTPPEKSCNECHKDLVKKIKKNKFTHPVLEKDKHCLNCHDPHGSPNDCNLERSIINLCLDCHSESIARTRNENYIICTIEAQLPQKHKPIADGQCSTCHNPHGSNYFAILNHSYPEQFYSPFKTKNYDLCFQCHDPAAFKNKKTYSRTNFRNGNQNLHYLHVNLKKGRTCRACHEVHSGKLPKQIREKVPFGKWSLPIGFKKFKDGGSCAPGCHKPYSYKRIQ